MKKISILLTVLIVLSFSNIAMAKSNNEALTRAEFIKEVVEAADIEISEVIESSFADVTDSEYMDYIEAAYERGFITDDEGEFNPEDNIIKEEAIVILVKAFGDTYEDTTISEEEIDGNLQYIDKATINPKAKPYIVYALDKKMIKDERSFYSKKPLTEKEVEKMIKKFKDVYEKLFMREGLTAAEMLEASSNKNLEFETYKQKGTMDMQIKMQIEGLPQEEIEEDEELKSMMNEGMNMSIDMDIQIENPDKAYIKEVVKANELEAGDQVIEIFMDETTMYTKIEEDGKWIKNDMSEIYQQMQELSGNKPYEVATISKEQLEFFKKYARFDENQKVDGEEYYVVNMDINKEAYKKYYKELIDKSIDSVIELQKQNPNMANEEAMDPEQLSQMMKQIFKDMEMEISYRFYIDKKTKAYEIMDITQDIYMNMDNLINMMNEMAEEEDKVDVKAEMVNHMEGQFKLYDFNKEITFPDIQPEDILDPMGMNQAIE